MFCHCQVYVCPALTCSVTAVPVPLTSEIGKLAGFQRIASIVSMLFDRPALFTLSLPDHCSHCHCQTTVHTVTVIPLFTLSLSDHCSHCHRQTTVHTVTVRPLFTLSLSDHCSHCQTTVHTVTVRPLFTLSDHCSHCHCQTTVHTVTVRPAEPPRLRT